MVESFGNYFRVVLSLDAMNSVRFSPSGILSTVGTLRLGFKFRQERDMEVISVS